MQTSRQYASGDRLEAGWHSSQGLMVILGSYPQASGGLDVTPLVVSAVLKQRLNRWA